MPSVLRLIESMFDAIEVYCLLPRGGHARFYYTSCGVRENHELQLALDKQARRVERAWRSSQRMEVAGGLRTNALAGAYNNVDIIALPLVNFVVFYCRFDKT